MQEMTGYDDIVMEINSFLVERIDRMISSGGEAGEYYRGPWNRVLQNISGKPGNAAEHRIVQGCISVTGRDVKKNM